MIGWLSSFVPATAWFTRQTGVPPSVPGEYFGKIEDWGRWENRLQRYDFNWAWWTNSVYDSAHLWSGQFKTIYGLYKYTRGTYNPMFRLGEFWATTTWGGQLNVRKQGGRVVQSAIPIITDNDLVREAIGLLWKYSRWQTQKQICARYGAVKGDVAIKVVDDEVNGKVRLAVVNPDTLRWVQLDPEGHVLAYELWEPRFDPRYDPRKEAPGQPGANEQTVIYGEKVRLDPVSKIVTFSTYLNGQPYGWYGNPPEWDRKYGFVPLVLHPHIQMHPGYFWGASEYTTAFRKACELDDVSSKQHDHIRKASAPKWFLSGVTAPKKPLSMGGNDPSATDTMPGRQQEEFFYAGVGAGATPMVFPVDNQFVSLEVQNQLMALEKDYPELRYDSARAAGDASAKALREVRKSAEAKVHDRRSGYDEALERVQKMALAIGGINGYPGFESFKDGQYFGEELDHEIGERSVFLMDPLDRIEEEQALATCWQTFKLAGWPDEVLMERFDFSPEEMLSFTAAAEAEKQKALDQQVALAQAKPAPTAPPAKAS